MLVYFWKYFPHKCKSCAERWKTNYKSQQTFDAVLSIDSNLAWYITADRIIFHLDWEKHSTLYIHRSHNQLITILPAFRTNTHRRHVSQSVSQRLEMIVIYLWRESEKWTGRPGECRSQALQVFTLSGSARHWESSLMRFKATKSGGILLNVLHCGKPCHDPQTSLQLQSFHLNKSWTCICPLRSFII